MYKPTFSKQENYFHQFVDLTIDLHTCKNLKHRTPLLTNSSYNENKRTFETFLYISDGSYFRSMNLLYDCLHVMVLAYLKQSYSSSFQYIFHKCQLQFSSYNAKKCIFQRKIRFPPSTRGIKQSSYSKLSLNLFILAYLYQFSKLCLYFLIYFSIISILNILSKNSAWSFILKSKVTLCEVIFKQVLCTIWIPINMEFNVTDKQTSSHTIKSSIRKVNQAFG